MRLWLFFFLLVLLSSCGSSRTETALSLLNVKDAAEYLLETELSEDQHRAAAAIVIAVDPGINLLSRDLLGRKKKLKPTVPKQDWHQSTERAKEAVVYQAAKANAKINKQFDKVKVWWELVALGVSLLTGAGGLAQARKIGTVRRALHGALEFANDALKVDPKDLAAVEAVKDKAFARKKGTRHEKELDAALIKMERPG